MENITHSLFGVALYRSGFERYVPNSMLLWIIGANLPDIDVVVNFFGKTAYLDHHRGFTHSLPGIVTLSILLATVWFYFKKRHYLANRSKSKEEDIKFIPPIWHRLFLASFLAVGTHPLLDALNNYGVKPFQPFSQKWFYGDLVFIVDPWIWLILGGAVFLSSKRSRNLAAIWIVLAVVAWQVMFFSGRVASLAIALWTFGVSLIGVLRLKLKALFLINSFLVVRVALVFFCSYLLILFYFQSRALEKVSIYLQKELKEPLIKFSVSPTPANPFAWEYLAESDSYFYYGKVDLVNNNVSIPKQIFVERNNAILKKALETKEGKAMKNFSRYLIADFEPGNFVTTVTLCDGRYVRDFKGSHPEFACIKVLVPK
jgi:inner membrane protein